MPSQTKTIDPASFLLKVGGVLIDGYADDGQVDIVTNNPKFKYKVGTTGEVGRFRVRDESGYIDIMLLQTSSSNAYLSSLAQSESTFGVLGRDTLGTPGQETEVSGNGCWLEKMPDVNRGNEIKTTKWRIIVPKMALFVGGNTENVDV